MYLQHHLALEPFLGKAVVYVYHCNLYDVCGTSLQWGVYGIPLAEVPYNCVAGVDVGKKPLAAVYGLHIAVFLGHCNHVVHVLLYLGVTCKILLNEGFGVGSGHSQPLRKAECGDSVNDSKIGCLGPAALLFGNFILGYLEHFCRSCGVDVHVPVEGINKVRVAAHVGHKAQLNLRVVCRNYVTVWRRRDECVPYLPAPAGADRDVLQVGIG